MVEDRKFAEAVRKVLGRRMGEESGYEDASVISTLRETGSNGVGHVFDMVDSENTQYSVYVVPHGRRP